MPSDRDWSLALRELVYAVYDYQDYDAGWDYMETEQAQQARKRMDQAANKIGLGLIGRPFNREELDLILGWEEDD
jgi:hypothetical protein